MEIRKAGTEDLSSILKLLEENHLTLSGVAEHIHDFLVVIENHQVIGCAGLEIYRPVALLRSVAVRKDMRGRGLGRAMVNDMLAMARKHHVETLYLLTTTAAEFFSTIGFARIERDRTDPLIRQTEEFSSICPCSAVVMAKDIR